MEKKTKDSESSIFKRAVKEIVVGVIVGVLVSLILNSFFTVEKGNGIILLLFFIIGLIVYLFIFLIRKLLKEVEAKKDLERQKGKLEESLERKQTLLYHTEKDKEKLEKRNENLENEKDQLELVLSRCGILLEIKEKVGIDGNIPFYE